MASSANTIYAAPLTRRKRGRSLYEAPPHLVAPPRSHVFDTPGAGPGRADAARCLGASVRPAGFALWANTRKGTSPSGRAFP